MTEEERRAKGRTRRLVFQNIANGVPLPQIRESLRVSDLEIAQAQAFVTRKINENRALRRQPMILCSDIRDIRNNRRALLGVLSLIGDLDLSTDLILSKMMIQQIDHPEIVEGAKRRMAEAYK